MNINKLFFSLLVESFGLVYPITCVHVNYLANHSRSQSSANHDMASLKKKKKKDPPP